MKLIFAVSYVSRTMGLTRCYITAVSLHLFKNITRKLIFMWHFSSYSIRHTILRRYARSAIRLLPSVTTDNLFSTYDRKWRHYVWPPDRDRWSV